MANRKDKKIQFYQYKIYAQEAELMSVKEKYDSLPKGALDVDKGRSNHLHRLRARMQQIEKTIKNYHQKIEEVKAM